ncbi:MAG: hypothetical protein D6736_01980, partial [Nitrospinota bacterium]
MFQKTREEGVVALGGWSVLVGEERVRTIWGLGLCFWIIGAVSASQLSDFYLSKGILALEAQRYTEALQHFQTA